MQTLYETNYIIWGDGIKKTGKIEARLEYDKHIFLPKLIYELNRMEMKMLSEYSMGLEKKIVGISWASGSKQMGMMKESLRNALLTKVRVRFWETDERW